MRIHGLIPAHAGKTPRRAGQAWRAGAHPRSRGENVRALAFVVPIVGSSPLTRGKPWREHGRVDGDGLIPAHAGKTQIQVIKAHMGEAHPRSRGENKDRPQTT